MLILGVDPGLTRCGLGLIDAPTPRQARLVEVSVVGTAAAEDVPARLAAIADAVEAALDAHKPAALALERVFSQQNVSTVMGTAQASGVVMLAAQRRGIPVALYTPSEVKAAVTGNGRAPKSQVAAMVVTALGLSAAPKPADAADALAIALCHAWRGSVASRAGSSSTAAQERWAAAEKAAQRRSR